MSEAVFEIVSESILEVLDDVEHDDICKEVSLRDLGANSIDRMDIIITTMEKAGVKIPLLKFAETKNIGEMAELIQRHI